jgi:transcriptional regulator with XRE-family HTH domain
MSQAPELPSAPGDPPALARVLAVLRVAHGLNQEEWARAAGVRAASISSYERGKLEPSHRMIGRLLGALGRPHAALRLVERFLADLGRLEEEEAGLDESAGTPTGTGLRREAQLLAGEASRLVRRAVTLFYQVQEGWPRDSEEAEEGGRPEGMRSG